MQLDLAVNSVQTHLVNVPAMLGTRVQHVTLLVDVIQLVQVEQLAMPLLVNVLATQDTLVPLATPVLQTIIGKVMEHVQVSVLTKILYSNKMSIE